ncbi:YtpI family protein [Paenibacillus sanguinis]|uniref:YtpI family protein n=1 Tax=Paenibacillus sanguinis TaxID=225906 RepID=UPI00037CA9E5|nr:YtpI family protein [Paenibacillus sanguinis]
MIETIQYILYSLLIFSCLSSLFFSFKSRRSLEPATRALAGAKMNISMGLMLIILALIQMLLFTGSTLRVVIGAIFMVLGAFNIFAGIRNHGMYSRQKQG